MILVIVPMLPALENKVTPNHVHIPKELSNLFAINWLYGFVASSVLYYVLNVVFPDKRTLIACVVQGETEVVEGVIASDESTNGNSGRAEKGLHVKEQDVEVKSYASMKGIGDESPGVSSLMNIHGVEIKMFQIEINNVERSRNLQGFHRNDE